MKKSDLKFSVALLKIGDVPFSLNSFATLQNSETEDIKVGDKVIRSKRISKEVREDRFVLIYFEEGAPLPRPPVVYNTSTKNDEDNPRSPDQIERDDQTFVLVDVSTQKVFLSDFRKKKILEEWFSNKLQRNVHIKNIIDRENFLSELKSIKKIFLSATPNLMSRTGILGQELTNDHHNYGVSIKNLEVKITFSDNSVTDLLRKKVLALFSQVDGHALEKLQITGRYDDKFDRIFNADGIVDRIRIDTTPQEHGMLDKNTVFSKLMERLR